MKGLNYDIVGRSEAARRSSRRAEARLARKFNQAGGIEDEMRYHLANMKREQANLRRELQGLRFEYKKFTKDINLQNGVIHKAHPDTDPSYEEVQHDENKNDHQVSADYGKNYFGYHSSPGSHKSHNRTVRDIEKSLECYYEKSNNEAVEHEAKKKLKQQKRQNKKVQDKVDTWKQKQPTRRRFSTTVPPNLRHLSFLRNELIHHDTKKEEKQSSRSSTPTLPPLPNHTESRKSSIITSPILSDIKATANDAVDGKTSNRDGEKHSSLTSPTGQGQKANELVFDADLYAPSGKLRMVHRLPDFNTAFNEARQARYVRTKHKREFEKRMSITQIFKD